MPISAPVERPNQVLQPANVLGTGIPRHFAGVNDLSTVVCLLSPVTDSNFTLPTPSAYQKVILVVRMLNLISTSTRIALYVPEGTVTFSVLPSVYVALP